MKRCHIDHKFVVEYHKAQYEDRWFSPYICHPWEISLGNVMLVFTVTLMILCSTPWQMNTWWILTWFCVVCIGQVSESGVHRPHVAGIHGRSNDGAYSLVLAGGYEDDVVCVRTLSPNHPSGSPSLCLPVVLFFHSRTMVMSSPTRAPGVATCLGTRERPSSPAIRSSPTWTGQKHSPACSRQQT